ncbi:vitamin K epoxide reductase family protein [Mucilaginibacter jinjuensis]|uniref:Thioredoxin domain-containing protein n=1 Tax=Mucilaginibacter jinjuensis TaxID=1176721 RepID=A0ABY7TFU2_9SPHI|nr:vitamin K epoxide reductase family protein [Mucilaginibacter jinjuensis]WCT14487.1 thioredoxin domain-containing protein [Mucilaginibacter jinjuensis]
MDSNITSVLSRLFRIAEIPVTTKSVFEEVTKHPYYPSVLTISDALDKWKVPNGAYELSFEELSEVPCPFIAHLTENGGGFALVTAVSSDAVTVYNEKWRNIEMSAGRFKNIYSGTILLAQSDLASGEADFPQKLFAQKLDNLRIPLIVLTIAFILLNALHTHLIAGSIAYTTLALIIFKTTGLMLSVLLLIQSIDANNAFVRRICGKSKKTDCNGILSSKAAKIAPFLNWSEAVFFYFSGTWILLLFNPPSASLQFFLAIINVLALPYTFYSIYYQIRVAKKWCLLCCGVQAILWLEFGCTAFYLFHPVNLITSLSFTNILLAFLFPIAAWAFIKPFLIKAQDLNQVLLQLNRFKYNPDLFWNLLKEQSKYGLPPDQHTLIFGNSEAEHVITIVSDPYCKPCAAAHEILDHWLTETNSFKLQVIFSTNAHPDDYRTKLAGHLMQVSIEYNVETAQKALSDWYSHQYDYKSWSAIYPVQDIPINPLVEQKNWAKLASIEVTPTIFIDGHRLPNTYRIEDLKYFIQ